MMEFSKLFRSIVKFRSQSATGSTKDMDNTSKTSVMDDGSMVRSTSMLNLPKPVSAIAVSKSATFAKFTTDRRHNLTLTGLGNILPLAIPMAIVNPKIIRAVLRRSTIAKYLAGRLLKQCGILILHIGR